MHSTYRNKLRALAAAVVMALPALALAQGYYDDDIYFDGAKAEEKARQARIAKQAAADKARRQQNYVPNPGAGQYASADTYVVNSGSTRDVDEYNRRGQFLVADSVYSDQNYETDDFNSTRRIERFHNSDIVAGSSDADLQYLYYNEPATVNVYINDPFYYPGLSWSWGWGGYRPWYSWSWNWGIYDPWWGPGWGPSWGWAWAPNPGWGWGCHGWGHGWGWGAPPRPNTPIGSSRPHYGNNGSYHRGYATSSRPGQGGFGTSSSRPGSNRYGTATGSSRPGYGGYGAGRPGQNTGVSTSRPAGANSAVGSGSTTLRGRNNSGRNTNTNTTRSSNQNYNRGNNYNSNRSGYSSGGGYGGGSRGGGYTGGGGSRSGGGGGRGRR